MSNHLTDEEMEMYWSRNAEGSLISRVAEHSSMCEACRGVIANARQSRGQDSRMEFALDERMWLSGEHLEYGDKRAYADGLTRGDDRAITEKHLSSCAECREEVAVFLEDRRENDRMPPRSGTNRTGWIRRFRRMFRGDWVVCGVHFARPP